MRERFTQYYKDHYAAILAFCRRRVASDAAEDLTAEVFTRAWRTMDRMQDPARPLPWLYSIARNVVGEHYRTVERHPEHATSASGTPVDVPIPPPTDNVDLTFDINRALNALSTDDQELLILSAWEDLDPKEIALVVGISPNTARVRLHRARTRLAQALEGVQS